MEQTCRQTFIKKQTGVRALKERSAIPAESVTPAHDYTSVSDAKQSWEKLSSKLDKPDKTPHQNLVCRPL